MTPSQLKWQKSMGFALPMLLGWFLFGWVVALLAGAEYVVDSTNYNLVSFLGNATCLLLVPVSGFAMGILNVYCWRNQNFSEHQLGNHTLKFLILFWLISLPLTIFLILSCLGWIIFPVHIACFRAGQDRGLLWIKTDALNKYFGKKHDWEHDEKDSAS